MYLHSRTSLYSEIYSSYVSVFECLTSIVIIFLASNNYIDQLFTISIILFIYFCWNWIKSKKVVVNNLILVIANLLLVYALLPAKGMFFVSFALSLVISLLLIKAFVKIIKLKSEKIELLIGFFLQLVVGTVFIKIFDGIINPSLQESLLHLYSLIIAISILVTLALKISDIRKALLFFPAIIAVVTYLLISKGGVDSAEVFFLGMFISGIIAGISMRLKFLSTSGSIATFILASLIFGFGGVKWSVPIMAFFILSSILSKLRKKNNEKIELFFEKTGVRDQYQVFANGGLGGIFVLMAMFSNEQFFYYLYLSSLAAVCADTWATEIGTYKRAKTYNVLTFKPIEQGRSGGISIPGTIAGVFGAFVICLSGIYWIQENVVIISLFIVFAGVVGSLVDSVIGATIQLQYLCINCEKITERRKHCGTDTVYYKGVEFINNDVVNFFAAVAAVLIILSFQNFLV